MKILKYAATVERMAERPNLVELLPREMPRVENLQYCRLQLKGLSQRYSISYTRQKHKKLLRQSRCQRATIVGLSLSLIIIDYCNSPTRTMTVAEEPITQHADCGIRVSNCCVEMSVSCLSSKQKI